MFKPYDSRQKYEKHLPAGVVPEGRMVKFTDGSTGRVVRSNAESMMIEYDVRGGGTAEDWFGYTEKTILGIEQ